MTPTRYVEIVLESHGRVAMPVSQGRLLGWVSPWFSMVVWLNAQTVTI
jgi:hypothetical protein